MKCTTLGRTLGGVLAGVTLLGGAVHAQNDNGGAPSSSISAGTQVKVKLLRGLSSDSAGVGDLVRAQVAGDDKSGLPTGTTFIGRVTSVKPATPKSAGQINVQFGTRPLGSGQDPADLASLQLTGKSASSDKSQDTTIGAGVGALLGLSRKRKLGDAVAGGALGALGGYAVNQSQKHAASDVTVKKGDEVSLRLDRSISLRTEINSY